MIVVSDTSPILNLAQIERLEIKESLLGKPAIPSSVNLELEKYSPHRIDLVSVRRSVEIRPPTESPATSLLRLQLDAGEADAITLGLELRSDVLLMDEKLGRMVASRLGLRCLGVIGLLIAAKKHKLIPQVKPLLDDLIHGAGFWVNQSLYKRALSLAGE